MKIVPNNSFSSFVQNKLDLTDISLIVSMIVCSLIGTLVLLIFLGLGGNSVFLSIAVCVIFVILVIIILAIFTSLFIKQETFIPKANNFYENSILLKKQFPLYFDPIPTNKLSLKNESSCDNKPSKDSFKKEEVKNTQNQSHICPRCSRPLPILEQPCTRKKTSFFKKVGKFFKNISLSTNPSYSQTVWLQYQKEEENLVNERAKGIQLLKCLQQLSEEDVLTVNMDMTENSSNEEETIELKVLLENWVRHKIFSQVFLSSYSPPGNGDCLFAAFKKGMTESGLETPSLEQLRLDGISYIKANFCEDNLCLLYLLNDFLECLATVFPLSELDKAKKEMLFERCGEISNKLSEKLVHLDIFECENVIATLKNSNSKTFTNCNFLQDFINIHARSGVFCGPAILHALAELYNVTIILHTAPPLQDSDLFLEGEVVEDLSLCKTKEGAMGCTGPLWKKNIMVFNAKAKTEKPICLGLLVNHFIFINMKEMA